MDEMNLAQRFWDRFKWRADHPVGSAGPSLSDQIDMAAKPWRTKLEHQFIRYVDEIAKELGRIPKLTARRRKLALEILVRSKLVVRLDAETYGKYFLIRERFCSSGISRVSILFCSFSEAGAITNPREAVKQLFSILALFVDSLGPFLGQCYRRDSANNFALVTLPPGEGIKSRRRGRRSD